MYGDPLEHPQTEEYWGNVNPIGTSPYLFNDFCGLLVIIIGSISNSGFMKICLLSGVRSCYDEGKRVAETLMFDYHRQHGIGMHILSPSLFLFLWWLIVYLLVLIWLVYYWTEIRIARIFNTYGPRMNIDDGRVVSNFIAQALR